MSHVAATLCSSSNTDGYQQLALKWVFEKNGGLATEADYPYIGVTNFCNTTGPMVKFKKVCRHTTYTGRVKPR